MNSEAAWELGVSTVGPLSLLLVILPASCEKSNACVLGVAPNLLL